MTLQADEPDDALDPAVADYLIGVLLAALPAAADEAADRARRNAVRVAFQSMRPRNPREAMLAAEAILLEIAEALAVATTVNAGAALVYSARVMDAFKEYPSAAAPREPDSPRLA